MYAAVVRFRFRAPVGEDDVRRIDREVIEPVTRLPGFRAYYGVRVSATEAVAVHCWDSQADLERATPQLVALTQQAVGDQLAGPPERTVGEVVIHRQA